MSWPVPTSSPWNLGNGTVNQNITPNINMDSLTQEQWMAMQQQNWQQWAQWQQQFAQWQGQFGDQYAAQIQAMKTMGGMATVPVAGTVTSVPPPPPPEKPPPPPPHENNQPLFAHSHNQPPPVSATMSYNQPLDLKPNPLKAPSNTLQYSQETLNQSQSAQSINSEALKKLAEEEKNFDIQFQKWEEEIAKWRRDNVNHPDKQAYQEYESKFEACRAQLLQRQQEMKQRKIRLMANVNSGPVTQPPVPATNSSSLYNPNQIPKIFNKIDNASNINIPCNVSESGYNKTSSNTTNTFDRHNTYQSVNTSNFHKPPNETTTFLPTNSSIKGIPGLDLVLDTDKKLQRNVPEVIDITENKSINQRQGPDYSNITKGINSILGDEKIMHMLSVVRGQLPPLQDSTEINSPSNSGNVSARNMHTLQSYDNDKHNKPAPQVARKNNLPSSEHESHSGYNMSTSFPDTRHNTMDKQYGSHNNQQYYGSVNANVPPYNENIGNQHFDSNYNMPSPKDNIPQFDSRRMPPFNNRNNANFSTQQNQSQQRMNEFRQNMQHQSQPLKSNQNIQNRSGLLIRPPLVENRNLHNNFHSQEMPCNSAPSSAAQPLMRKWVEEPMFTPSIVVEYDHKPLRLKARDFIEPVHMFDYNHKSKEDDIKKDFEKEADDLFGRLPNQEYGDSRDFERRPRDEFLRRNPYIRNDLEDRSRYGAERRYDDRDKFNRREDFNRERDKYYERSRDLYRSREIDRDRDLGREREIGRDREMGREREREMIRDRELGRERDVARNREMGRDREMEREKEIVRDRGIGKERDLGKDSERYDSRERDRRDDYRRRSRSRERDSRKRGPSSESELVEKSKRLKENENQNSHIVMINDLLEPPGRDMRPEKFVIILRGPPGSGKSYLAKLIRDKEAEYGGTARIMSIDDYFMQEGEIEEKDPATGKIVKKPSLKYEYDSKLEESYINSLKRAFKRTITDGYFSFLIYDAVNDQLKSYADIWNFSRQNGFQVYICTMDFDSQTCFKRNIHNRTLEDIEIICTRFFPTPTHHIKVDPATLLQSAAIIDVDMEDVSDDVIMEDVQEPEVENTFISKWEKMDDVNQLARLDGTSKPLRPSKLSMEDYLQIDDWKPNQAKPGKKTVRWADIEERREQEKMRAIGFVVGQTDWNRMTDPTMGSSALTQTKYIERVKRN